MDVWNFRSFNCRHITTVTRFLLIIQKTIGAKWILGITLLMAVLFEYNFFFKHKREDQLRSVNSPFE